IVFINSLLFSNTVPRDTGLIVFNFLRSIFYKILNSYVRRIANDSIKTFCIFQKWKFYFPIKWFDIMQQLVVFKCLWHKLKELGINERVSTLNISFETW